MPGCFHTCAFKRLCANAFNCGVDDITNVINTDREVGVYVLDVCPGCNELPRKGEVHCWMCVPCPVRSARYGLRPQTSVLGACV